MIAALLAAAVVSSGQVAAEIRQLRGQYNAAVAAHDIAAVRRFYFDDYVVVPGSSGSPLGLETYNARLAKTFADPTFVTFARSPVRVVLAGSGKRAAEAGTWVGTYRKPDGEMRVTGVYQAYWAPTPDGAWKLKNESFVTLNCSGSKGCAEFE